MTISLLDFQQIIQRIYDESNNSIRVEVESPLNMGGELEVAISAADGDSVILSDGTHNLVINPDGSINVTATISTAGLATSVKQDIGNASLASIDSKLTSPLTINLPSGAATASNQATANTSLASIDSKLTSPIVVTGPLTDTQLRASAVPISATFLPLPSGASTLAAQNTGNSSLASIDSKLTSPLSVVGPLTDIQLRATPVSISGTIAANQSGTWNINNISGTISLPTGAATSANQTTANTSLSSIDSKLTSPLTTNSRTQDGSGNLITSQVDGSERSLNVRDSAKLVDVKFDEVQGSYPDSVTEVYTYKRTASTVATVTIIYQDATKKLITSVVRT